MNNSNVRPITVVATFFTLTSLAWTAYSVTDLMAAGPWGLLAAVSVDGLWGVVQYLDYKGIGGRTVRWLGWAALAAACGLLAYHGWTINPAAAIAAALPPIVAKAAWIGDIRLRRDPTALTPDQEAEINDVIRDAEYIARMKTAEIERDAAAEIALIQAQAKVTLARDEADFTVGVERLRKRAELERRRPLELSPAGHQEASTAMDGPGSTNGYEYGAVPETPVFGPFSTLAALSTKAVADEPDTVALLTVSDVAKARGVAEGTVRSWVARNRLTPVQRDEDGRLLFHPDAVASLS